ncbi:MAG: fumarate reductase subunit C [Hyphomicrobiales bacterium]|nr:fumarate reductase subunit C [Hyphomicrobiales bacterium]
MDRRPYIREMPKLWWLGQRRYTVYMIRELSCVFIGAYVLVILVGLFHLSQGPAAYAAFLDALQSPLAIAFHLLALVFALLHTVTWFGLTPKAMPLRLGENTVPGTAIVMAHYVVWIVVSAGLLLAARV